MTKNLIQKKLIDCNSELDSISRKLYEIRELERNNDFNGYKESAFEIARNAERFACQMRRLVLDTVFYNKNDFMLDISKSQGITIEKENNWIKIVMPFLLPKKRITQSCSFILDPLDYVLRDFVAKTREQAYDNCVICFRNIYTIGGKSVRDHDNIETKKVLDVIAAYLLVDDAGLLCSNFYTTTLGDSEQTEVYVVSKNDFEKWLKIYPV